MGHPEKVALVMLLILLGLLAFFYVGWSTPKTVEETAKKSVVEVRSGNSVGSGVIISQNEILSACHVVKRNSKAIINYNNTSYEGRVVGVDESLDLSLIVLDKNIGYRGVELAESVKFNETVFSYSFSEKIGNFNSIIIDSSSYISSEGENYFRGIRREVQSGYSGGPTFNTKGELVGIQFAKIQSGDKHIISLMTSLKGIKTALPKLRNGSGTGIRVNSEFENKDPCYW